MSMHNPPHPGEFIQEVYLNPPQYQLPECCPEAQGVTFHLSPPYQRTEQYKPGNGPAAFHRFWQNP